MVLTHRYFAAIRCLTAALLLCLAWSGRAANSPPTANPDSYTVNEDQALVIAAPGVLANDTDPNGDPISAVFGTLPTHGTLVAYSSNGSFTYRPNTNYNGTDSFTYRAFDASSTSAPVTVTITINPSNDVSLATNDSYNATSGVALVVNAPGVLANDGDVDGDPLTALLATNVTHGTLVLNPNGSFTYTSATNYIGPDSFSYRVSDGSATSAVATVTITVSTATITVISPPVNQSVCVGDTVTYSVTASGTAVTYQWQKNSAPIAGKTNSTLILTNVTAADAATYSVKMTNSVSAITNNATLSVNTQVTATALTNLVRYVGAVANFSTTPSGTGPFTYEWLKGSNVLAGQTNRSLTLSNVVVSDTETYSVIVSGACRSVTNSATLLAAYCFNSLDVMMVIDRSASMVGTPYADAKTAATNFVRNLLLGTNGDIAGLTSFNPSATLNSILTNSAAALNQAIGNLPSAGGGTCISCGISTGQAELASIRHRSGASPVMVLLTDGVPKAQDGDYPSNVLNVAQQAKNAGTRVFTLGLNDGSGTNVDKTLLANTASSTNDFFYANSSSELTAVFNAISTVLCRGPANVVGPAPTNVTVCAGANVNFGVAATGCIDFAYQWRKNGVTLGGQTNGVLSLPNVQTNDAGFYSVIVTSPCGNVTNGASLTVNSPVQIIVPPTDIARCPGASASFNVSATGTGLSYQWRKGASPLTGATNTTLSLNNVSTNDAGSYSVVVSGVCGSVTNSATLTLSTPAQIVAGPASLARCVGDGASFTVSATGAGLSYQWRKGSSALLGETNNTLTINPVGANDAGTYSVEVTGSCGNATNSATLAVNAPVEITVGPMPLTKCAGDSASFTVSATGTGLTYVWRKSPTFDVVPGATNGTLTLTNVSTADAATYYVFVSDTCGNSTSTSATLDVNTPPVLTPLLNKTSCPNTVVSFQTTATGAGPFTYLWRKNGTTIGSATGPTLSLGSVTQAQAGTYSIEVSGACGTTTNSALLVVRTLASVGAFSNLTLCSGQPAAFAPVIGGTGPFSFIWRKDGALLPAETNASLSIASVTTNHAGVYVVEVTGPCNSATNSGTLTVNELTSATPLANAPVCAGGLASFATTVAGAGPFTIVWRRDGQILGAATNSSLTISNATVADIGTYTVEVSGTCNAVTNSATLTVNQLTTATPLVNATRCVGNSVTFSSVASGAAPLTFVWRKDGALLPLETNSSLSIASVATNHAGTYTLEVSGACGRITNSALLTVRELTTATPLINAVACIGNVASFTTLVGGTGPVTFVWRKDGIVIPGETNASLFFSSVTTNHAGLYSVEVNGACNAVTNSATLAVNQLTTATALANATRCVGDTVTFSSVAGGASPLTFVWRKDGALLPLETNSNLNIASVTTNHAGTYTLEVSGACGRITNSALLTVRELATATPLSSAVVCVGNPVSFATVPGGTGPFIFTWRKDGTLLVGETNASLAIVAATNQSAGVYAVEVQGACNTVTNSASLIVNGLTIAPSFADKAACAGDVVSFGSTPAGTGPFAFRWRKSGSILGFATNATLIISNATIADSGFYTVEITGACNSVTNGATLVVRDLITTTPLVDATRCTGDSVTFAPAPSGTGPFNFVWRKNGALLGSETNSSLSIASVSTNDAGVYTIEISGACNSITNSATLTVREPTQATALADAVRCVGDSATFSTVVSGSGPFSFVWRKNGTVIPAETNASISFSGLATNASGVYAVEVTGACNSVTNSATLVVNEVTTATPLTGVNACPGSLVSFTTTAHGSGPVVFVWRKVGAIIPGATNATLLLSNVTLADRGSYAVEVTGPCNSVTNTAVLLLRQLATATALSNATRCVGESATFSTVASGGGPYVFVWRKDGVLLGSQTNNSLFTSSVATNDAGIYTVEISGPCNTVTNAATLVVRPPTAATPLTNAARGVGESVTFSTTANGTGPFSFLWRKDSAVIPGETNASLILNGLTTNDAGVYSIEVAGLCDVVTNSATLVVNDLTTATPLADASVCAGGLVSFATIAHGTGPFIFAWRKDGLLIDGATNASYVLSNTVPADGGTYAVEVMGAYNAVTNAATLIVSAPTTATSLSNVTRCIGDSATFSTVAGGAAPIAFVWRKDGALLSLETNSSLSLPSVSTNDLGVYSVEVIGACNTVTNSATLAVHSPATVSPFQNIFACESTTVTLPGVAGGDGPFNFVWRKDGALLAGQTNATLVLNAVTAVSAGTYTLEAYGACSAATNAVSLTVEPLPTALTNQSRCSGETALFSTTVSGAGPFTFTWRKNGTLLNNETNSTLVVTNVQASDAGAYRVEIIGACALVTNSATLAVIAKTSATPLASVLRCAGTSVSFTTTASGLGPFNYVWCKDGVVMAGRTNASIILTNITTTDAAQYSVEVAGACGSVTNSATLTVNTSPVVLGLTNVLACLGDDVLFAPAITGLGTFTNIWRKNGALLTGETNATLLITGVNAAKAGSYSLEVNGLCAQVSNTVTLTLRTNVTVAAFANLSRCQGSSVTFTGIVAGTGPCTFVWKKDGAVISNATSTAIVLTNLSQADSGLYSLEVVGPCNTATASGTLTVGAATAATPLQDLTACSGQSAMFSTIISGGGAPYTCVWRKNGSVIAGQTNSALLIGSVAATDAGTYSVEVMGCNHVTNTAQLTVRTSLSATMPSSLVACTCSDVFLSPTNTGTGPFTYLWKKDNSPLAGETNQTLVLTRLNTASPGIYSVEISGPCNTVTKSTVLDVINPTSGIYVNTNAIIIPEFGAASPYPAAILVQCAPIPVTELRVTLFGLSHSFPDDLDIMLVGPNNTAVKLMSDCGGGGANLLNGVDLTFDSSSSVPLPDATQIVSGTYRPTDYNGLDGDLFQPPAPSTSTNLLLSSFYGSNPNGVWSLYVTDDHGRDGGGLTGWSLDFGHTGFVFTNVSLSKPEMLSDGSFRMQLSGTPNRSYYLEASSDLKQWTIIQTNQLNAASAILTDTTAPQFNYRFYRANGCRD